MKKFLLAVGVALMAMSANAENWFISGAFQGWNHAAAEYQFTDKGNGVFELALNETFEGEFTIFQGEGRYPRPGKTRSAPTATMWLPMKTTTMCPVAVTS